MTPKFMILQSGFLAFESDEFILPIDTSSAKAIQDIELGKSSKDVNNKFFYHKEIDTIYSIYNNDHRVLKEFDFRERLLTAVKHAFNTKLFKRWFTLQLESPFLTNLHRQFLVDLLTSIYRDNRTINVESWIGLIEPRQTTEGDSKVDLDIDAYFTDRDPGAFIDAMRTWTSHENGFKDMLISAYIIFGRQYERKIF